MQYPADENPIRVCPVDDNMFPMLDAPVSRPDLVTRPPHSGRFNQPPESFVKTIEVALGLVQTPSVHGVFGNLDQVEPGQP